MRHLLRKCTFLLLLSAAIFSSCKKTNADPVTPPVTPPVIPPVIPPVTKDSTISTIAGTGSFGFSGDGGPAVSAQFGLSSPTRVVADKAGNIYVSDNYNKRIRKINMAGIITTIAGSGSGGGFSGDGGLATAAKLDFVEGLTVDDDGNVYIACNARIRKVSSTGIITTIAGGGSYSANDGVGGLATLATLNLPQDVCLDSLGNIFIADYGNHSVKRVDKTSGIITIVAGTGAQGYTGDNGPAINAKLSYPEGVAADSAGNIYITTSKRIRKLSKAGVITTVAGTGTGSFNAYNGAATAVNIWPTGITFNNKGELIIADYPQSLVRKMDANGYITTIAGYGGYNKLFDGGKPYLAGFTYPSGVASDAKGNIYIADYGATRVRKITLNY